MQRLQRFDPPAFMNDLERVKDGLSQWDEFIDKCFEWALEKERERYNAGHQPAARLQYFNPKRFDPGEPVIEQPILWNAFPKTLLLTFGRDRALAEADELIPYNPVNTFPNVPGSIPARPFDSTLPGNNNAGVKVWTRRTDEYCEWRVERTPSGQIKRVTFTSEPPEYWQAIFGGKVQLDNRTSFTFRGDPKVAAEIYRDLLNEPNVQPDDLRATEAYNGIRKGDYDPYNRWNTTHGIVHLCCPPNAIAAEILLGGDATVLHHRPDGELVTNPDELICRAHYGGVNRNSDPTIGASVNALARAGAMITLVNPVGLYMDNIDLAGWEVPGGVSPSECVKHVRGSPGRIERLVVEVPLETGYCLSDVTIGGAPIRYGGQIAECITVKLTGGACRLGSVTDQPINGIAFPFLSPTRPSFLSLGKTPTRAGYEPAFAQTSQTPLPPAALPTAGPPLESTTARGIR